eukprot:CAMPEP_0117688026 /NCGR_PEP_ID=MMETSP0804-20121206/23540_1 /TAXON_ID=1074897 /ORGANISM="Tetraselmis astigmatica, Strain CCMP880" /LENGTH=405 /DNA_ID=CAMNT_0005500311 /DNA_START=260 /DNA_END=1477 /DNA_ORIENTATION=+
MAVSAMLMYSTSKRLASVITPGRLPARLADPSARHSTFGCGVPEIPHRLTTDVPARPGHRQRLVSRSTTQEHNNGTGSSADHGLKSFECESMKIIPPVPAGAAESSRLPRTEVVPEQPVTRTATAATASITTHAREGVELLDTPQRMVQSSIAAGSSKVMYPRWQNAINGILGGAFVSIGFFFACCVAGGAPGLQPLFPGLQKLLLGLSFPFGLCMVVLTGAELLTSSFSTVGAAWLPASHAAPTVLKEEVSSSAPVRTTMQRPKGKERPNSSFWRPGNNGWRPGAPPATQQAKKKPMAAVTKGIVCNWLVSLAVFMAFAAQDVAGKMLAIWPPITAFVAMGMDHCVANMWLLPLGLLLGADYSLGDMILHNILPVTIGNFIGSQLCSAVFNTRFKRTFWEAKES